MTPEGEPVFCFSGKKKLNWIQGKTKRGRERSWKTGQIEREREYAVEADRCSLAPVLRRATRVCLYDSRRVKNVPRL